jgi:small-conductance mechanosensitive channel/CRP-like cAMP-binding protein
MSVWQRLLDLTAASPFTGTWMSLATTLGALFAVLLLRRLVPLPDRQTGTATVVLLSVGLVLGLCRLVFVATGADMSTAGRVVSVMTTLFVALGAVNTAILFMFEVVPAKTRLRLPTILRDLVQMVAFIVILFGSLSQSGLANFVSFITTSAVLTAVVGLALQNTITNLFAGIVLHMDSSLNVGDWIQLQNRVGRISQIRWRSTILRTTDGDNVIVPNGQFTAHDVYNYSRPTPKHRVWVKVSFAYQHPPNEVRQMLIIAARGAPGVLAEPPPDSFPTDFGESGVVYAVRFWIDEFVRGPEIEGEVRGRIWYAARRAGLEIPYPTRNIHVLSQPASAGAGDSDLPERVTALRRIDLFANLEGPELELLASGVRKVRFAAGEPIIRQGEAGDSLFIIIQGDVLVSLGQGTIHQSVTTLRAGDFFGEMSLITGEPRSATCAARTDVLCYVIDHDAFRTLLAQRPQVAEQLTAVLTTRQAALEKKGGELSARAAQAAEHRSRLLAKIRSFFDLR